jgi:hypothetical protein
MTVNTASERQPRLALRTIGFWLAVPLALLQAVNAARAISDPMAFSAYMGAPVVSSDATAWVYVYALRTGFISLLVTFFLVRRDVPALKWTAVAALVMPLGDAWIAHQSGAALSIVARHLAIEAYLIVTVIALTFAARAAGRG